MSAAGQQPESPDEHDQFVTWARGEGYPTFAPTGNYFGGLWHARRGWLAGLARRAAAEAPTNGDLVTLPRAVVDSTLDALRKAQMFKVSTALSNAVSTGAAPEAPTDTRSFWVLEKFADGRSAGYWDGGHSLSFTNDIDKACQFCRKEDVFWATRGWRGRDTQLTEHVMLSGSTGAAPEAPVSEQQADAWMVGLQVFKTRVEAEANIRDPDIKPLPMYRDPAAATTAGADKGEKA